MLNGFYNNADIVANKLLEINNSSYNYNYRKGYIYFMMSRNPKTVINYLTKATGKTVKNYDIYSKKNRASVDVFYYLGVSYQNLANIDSSNYYFNLFQQKSSKNSPLVEFAKNRLKQNENANKRLNEPRDGVIVKNLGNEINSIYPEYASVISLDGSMLYYTAKRPWGGDTSNRFQSNEDGTYPDDIYMSQLKVNTWSKPERLNGSTPGYNEATVSINFNSKTLYTYSDSTGRGDIYYTYFEGKDIKDPIILDIIGVNNKKDWEPSIYVTEDGKRLYFTSDRKGGYGGRDIYICKKSADGVWSAPENMGPSVNTAYDEDAPFESMNGKYFYYASNNDKSMGGFDVFYAAIDKEGKYAEGKALPYPLNSTGDDIYYTSTQDGRRGYLTSSRADSYGDKDIYEIENNYLGIENVKMAIISLATVDNVQMPESVKVRFTCKDCDEKEAIVYPNPNDGVVAYQLEKCKEYTVEYLIGEEEKVMHSEKITTSCEDKTEEFKRSYTINVPNKEIVGFEKDKGDKSTDTGREIAVAQFNEMFGYNKNKLDQNDPELKDLIAKAKEILKDDKLSLVFEIYSSASTVPTKTYGTNERLAQLRANNAMTELIRAFSSNDKLMSRIQVVIKEAAVNGPAYNNDAQNKEKYAEYQYVKIKTIVK